jgi:hypothetical protein
VQIWGAKVKLLGVYPLAGVSSQCMAGALAKDGLVDDD